MYEICLSLHSLNQKDINLIKPILARAADELNLTLSCTEEVLRKSTAKLYQNTFSYSDGSILVHRNSGRMLLTGKNGLYDKVIRELYYKNSSLPFNSQAGTSSSSS
jgi:hypothetical protein